MYGGCHHRRWNWRHLNGAQRTWFQKSADGKKYIGNLNTSTKCLWFKVQHKFDNWGLDYIHQDQRSNASISSSWERAPWSCSLAGWVGCRHRGWSSVFIRSSSQKFVCWHLEVARFLVMTKRQVGGWHKKSDGDMNDVNEMKWNGMTWINMSYVLYSWRLLQTLQPHPPKNNQKKSFQEFWVYFFSYFSCSNLQL